MSAISLDSHSGIDSIRSGTPSEYPAEAQALARPEFSDPPTDVTEIAGKWWIAVTKPQAEKRFAADLAAKKIGHFLPLRRETAIYSGRKFHSDKPLFQGYVSFAGDDWVRYDAVMTRRVLKIIPVVDQTRFVRELSGIQRALACDPRMMPYGGIPLHTRVRVTQGPLMGVEGFVEAKDKLGLLVLRLSMLGGSSATEIEPDFVELLA